MVKAEYKLNNKGNFRITTFKIELLELLAMKSI